MVRSLFLSGQVSFKLKPAKKNTNSLEMKSGMQEHGAVEAISGDEGQDRLVFGEREWIK
jgi:hypothetical protein